VGAGLAAIVVEIPAVIWQPVSIELKPLPCTVILVLIGPSFGVTESTTLPAVTVNIAVALAVLGVPVTSIS
jgi:hypothetical protein